MNSKKAIVIESDEEGSKFSDEELAVREDFDIKIENEEENIVPESLKNSMPMIGEEFESENVKKDEKEDKLIQDCDIFLDDTFSFKIFDYGRKAQKNDTTEITEAKIVIDQDIVDSDIPERLQKALNTSTMQLEIDRDQLQIESNWILSKKLDDPIFLSIESVKEKIIYILEQIKKNYNEPIYIYQNLFKEVSGFQLKDVFWILESDIEWNKLQELKSSLIEKCTKEIEKKDFLINNINNCEDEYMIQTVKDQIEFEKFKIGLSSEGTYQQPFDSIKEIVESKNFFKTQQTLSDIFLTPMQFHENLINKKFLHRPKCINANPNDYHKSLELDTPIIPFLQNVARLMAFELYCYPPLRKLIKDLYLQEAKISTRPFKISSGEFQTTNLYNINYCVKRIKNKPLNKINGELGLLMLKNAYERRIEIKIHTIDDDLDAFNYEPLPDQETIFKKLAKLFIDDSISENSHWNLIRKETLNIFLQSFMNKELYRQAQNHIREKSEDYIIDICTRKLSEILTNGPCLSSSNPKNYAKIMSVIVHKEDDSGLEKITAGIIDENGMPLKFSSSFDLKLFLMLGYNQNISTIQTSNKEYVEFQNFVIETKPELIVLGDHRISRRIIRHLIREKDNEIVQAEKLSSNIIYCTSEFSSNISELRSKFLWMNNDESDKPKKIITSLGRLQQNFLCELSKLWHDDVNSNMLLNIEFHELQPFVNQSKLHKRYQETFIEIVNRSGVDLNDVINNQHRAAVLQFVGGFGVHKANFFLKEVKEKKIKTFYSKKNQLLNFSKGCFQSRIFLNSAIALKINCEESKEKIPSSFKINSFDRTRIPIPYYSIAQKICEEVYDDIEGDNYLQKAMLHPERLDRANMQEFADHLEKKGNKNIRVLLDHIVDELKNPFPDYRRPFSELDLDFLFYKMTQQPKFQYQPGAIILCKILKLNQKNMNVRLECGVETMIESYDIFEKEKDEMLKTFFEGQTILARIKSVKFETLKLDLLSLMRLDLTVRPTILNDHVNYINRLHKWIDKYNIVDVNEDFPPHISNARKQGKFLERPIMHNRFKNITTQEAEETLQDKEPGEFIFHPSKKQNEIFLTWKMYHGIYAHIEIQEHKNNEYDILGQKLFINKKCFSSLNEIIAQCNSNVRLVSSHQKFFKGDDISNHLLLEKEADPKKIPYSLQFNETAPQYGVLSYMKNSEVIKENFKIENDGFKFHDLHFVNLSELLYYFKKNFSNSDYLNFLASAKEPYLALIIDDSADYNDNNYTDSYGIEHLKSREQKKTTLEELDKIPDFDNIHIKKEKVTNQICEYCGTKGHNYSQCPLKTIPDYKPESDGNSFRKSNNYNKNNAQSNDYDNQNDSWFPKKNTPSNESEILANKPSNKNAFTSCWSNNESELANKSSTWGESSWGNEQSSKDAAPSWGQSDWGNKESDGVQQEPKSNAWGGQAINDNLTTNWNTNTEWGDSGSSQPKFKNDSGDRSSFGGKGGSNTCFKCNEVGHMSRECPNSDKNPRPKGCFNCGEEGHMSKECPKPKKNSGMPREKRSCFNCGEDDHMSKDCTNPKKITAKRACFNCGDESHMSKECPNPRKSSGLSDKKKGCFNCGDESHMSRECPNPKKSSGFGDKKRACFNCGDENHMSKECPQPRKPRTGPMKCFKCDEEGHSSRDCPNKPSYGGNKNRERSRSKEKESSWGGSWGTANQISSNNSGLDSGWGNPTPLNTTEKKLETQDTWGSKETNSWNQGSSAPMIASNTSNSDGWGESKPESKSLNLEANQSTWGEKSFSFGEAKDRKSGQEKQNEKSSENQSKGGWGDQQNGSFKIQEASAQNPSWKESKTNSDWGETKHSTQVELKSGGSNKNQNSWGDDRNQNIKAIETPVSSWGDSAWENESQAKKSASKETNTNSQWGGQSNQTSSWSDNQRSEGYESKRYGNDSRSNGKSGWNSQRNDGDNRQNRNRNDNERNQNGDRFNNQRDFNRDFPKRHDQNGRSNDWSSNKSNNNRDFSRDDYKKKSDYKDKFDGNRTENSKKDFGASKGWNESNDWNTSKPVTIDQSKTNDTWGAPVQAESENLNNSSKNVDSNKLNDSWGGQTQNNAGW